MAAKLGRNAIGIELNPGYVEMSVNRLKAELGMLCQVEAISVQTSELPLTTGTAFGKLKAE